MTAVAGGLRERLIAESIHYHMRACLSALGWLSPDPGRKDLTYLTRPAADGEKIVLNTLAVFSERVRDTPLELGNTATIDDWQWYADVYAEDEAVGMHLSGDVRAILQGRMPAVGADRPTIDVYDFTVATPPLIFWVDIEDVTRDRPPAFTASWKQFWFSVPFTVVDEGIAVPSGP